ncbi:DNA primase [Sanguibacteroides justesenii]|uniref:DNA primase n=1 Tax=Sanguibacteroides justesenii TaxID=1547597 RepID=UPI000D87E66A|nr:DNA primase [Sanguibacteroides justesenii]PXZ44736.1 DNA primase [Sanguibacteroides justesenii]
MQIKEIIDRINDDIVEVLSHYVELKKNGHNYLGLCPFHPEKTPSFTVTPAKGKFKCFGCGEGGDVIDFIKKHEGVEFLEAVKIAAAKLGIDFSWKEDKDFNEREYKHQEALHIVCNSALEYFKECLLKSTEARKYIEDRGFSIDNDFDLGYAPAGNRFLAWAREKGLNTELLLEADLIKKADDGHLYDTFRDRVMFPIFSATGKPIAFSGRVLKKDSKSPKYINSSESPIYKKGDTLLGLNFARRYIKNENRVYLVEGNFDVLRMYSIGVPNTVAPCGTALTDEQINVLSRYTRSVTLLYDGDEAGLKATVKNAEALIKKKLNVDVILLPEKEDPDSYFTLLEKFEKYKDENAIDYIVWKVKQNQGKCRNPQFKSEFMKEVAFLVAQYEETSIHEVYIDSFTEYVKPRKAWQDAVARWLKDKSPSEKSSLIPKNISLGDYQEHGFYIDSNCYHFADTKGKPRKQSNFILVPLFHIESTINAKRTYEVVNEDGIRKVIEIAQKDLNMISSFRLKIESLGNFWWNGSDSDLNKLKIWLYKNTESCIEITQLGWQEQGFFAWGNGIFAGNEFKPVNDIGIVKHEGKSYYLPAFSRIYEKEKKLFTFERNFIHLEGNITLKEYMKKFVDVHGDNGKVAFCFYLACLFRDIIVNKFRVFPLLNMFGPKGSGKSGCAESLAQMFGVLGETPNLFTATKAALGDHVAAAANALCVVDEYRNDMEVEKREFLKGIWGGSGRTRINMDKDKKRETTAVDQGVVVCGQQMADADTALLTRFIFLGFMNDTHTPEEKKRYQELKEIEKRGITHLTNRILKLRTCFMDGYSAALKKTQAKMEAIMKGRDIMDRIFNNWMMVLAAYTALEDYLELPWSWDELIEKACDLMIVQGKESEQNDDLGKFWRVIQFLASSNYIFEGGDYKFVYEKKIKRIYSEGDSWKKEDISFSEPKELIYLNTSRIFSFYRERVLKEGEKPLPESTIQSYLKNTKAFICDTKKVYFNRVDPKTGIQELDENKKKKYTSTSAFVFDYSLLPLSIRNETKNEGTIETENITTTDEPQQKLPF